MAAPTGTVGKLVSRDVEPAALRPLLEHPPRASLAFIDRDRADLLPVRYRLQGEAHLIGVAGDVPAAIDGREVVLVIDDGAYWFELRGISFRGIASRIEPPNGAEPECAWYVIAPRRAIAWDYAAIRDVSQC